MDRKFSGNMKGVDSATTDRVPPDIGSLIPHAPPMVLLDRVLAHEGETLIAEVGIRPDSLFCGADGVGGWVGIEYMAQAIAAHAGYAQKMRGESAKVGFLLGSRRYECHCGHFAIGSVLQVHVERMLLSDNGLGSYDCQIRLQEQVLATATVTVFQPENVANFLEGDVNE